MSDILESGSFVLPSLVRTDVANRLKASQGVKSVELLMKGDLIDGAREFGQIVQGLKKRGVKVSHDFSIKLEFPRSISRETALELVERMPKPKNGSIKVRLQLEGGGT